MNKAIPKINTQLRSHTILVPEVYREATGVLMEKELNHWFFQQM